MFLHTFRSLRLLGRHAPSRAAKVRPFFRPTFELLEIRAVPTVSVVTSNTEVANSQHAYPYTLSGISDYEVAYSTYGNTDSAWVAEETGSSSSATTLNYSVMNSSGTTFYTGFASDLYDAYGRLYSQVHFGSANDKEVDIAVAPNGVFAMTYILTTWHYANPRATTPDSTTDTVYVQLFAAGGSPSGLPTSLDAVVSYASTPYDRNDIQDPKVGVDATGEYDVVWSRVHQVDPSGATHGYEDRTLYSESLLGGTPEVVSTSHLDVGNGNGFGAPWDWTGDRLLNVDLATNSYGQSVVVWARMVNVTPPVASEYLALDAIYGQRLDAYGAVSGSQLTISQNADTDEPNGDPRVALNDSGQFAVAWTYIPPYTISSLPATRGVYARAYNSSGPVTNEILVYDSPHTESIPFLGSRQFYVDIGDTPVGIDSDGKFIVGFVDHCTQGSTPTHDRVRVQAYNADGTTDGGIVNIATNGSPILDGFELSMASNGTFVTAGIAGTPNGSDDETIYAWLWSLT